METETIDRLFLELSQFTRATTGKELALANQLAEAKAEIVRSREALKKICHVTGSDMEAYDIAENALKEKE